MRGEPHPSPRGACHRAALQRGPVGAEPPSPSGEGIEIRRAAQSEACAPAGSHIAETPWWARRPSAAFAHPTEPDGPISASANHKIVSLLSYRAVPIILALTRTTAMPRATSRQPVTMSGDLTARIMFAGRSSSLSAQIVGHVRDALFAKQLKPGDFLGTEKDLAGRFGTSRIVARDALRTLEALGIVEIRMGKGGGARIAHGNPRLFAEALAVQLDLTGVSVAEIMDAQRAIETLGAELAAENATAEDVARLRLLLKQAANVSRRPRRLHEAVARLPSRRRRGLAQPRPRRAAPLARARVVAAPQRHRDAEARRAHPRHPHQARRSHRAARRRRGAHADGRPRQDDPRPARRRARAFTRSPRRGACVLLSCCMSRTVALRRTRSRTPQSK